MQSEENLIIIGGGPAGLAAGIYAARASLNPLIIAGSIPGGQLMLTTEVENYPGFSSIMGPELMKKMLNQAKQFGARVINEDAKKIEIHDSPFRQGSEGQARFMIQDSSKAHETRSVLVATGAEVRWLGLESEQRLRGKGVSACATCDGFFYKDKVVGVVGGGDSALEEALFLTRFATKIYLIHRRDALRGSKIMQERVLKHPKIEIVWNSIVEEVLGQDKVEGIQLKTVKNRQRQRTQTRQSETENTNPSVLKLQGLFIAIGHKPSTEFLKGSGVRLDEKGYIVTAARAALKTVKNRQRQRTQTRQSETENTNSTVSNRVYLFPSGFNYLFMTSLSGIFAAGDCVDYQYRQAGTAVGMGIAAELEIERYLEDNRH